MTTPIRAKRKRLSRKLKSKMGIILIGLIGISTLYLIRWLVSKFKNWSNRLPKSSLKWELFQVLKVAVIIIVSISAFGLCMFAATFDYSMIFK